MNAISVFGEALTRSIVEEFGYSAQIRAQIEREVEDLFDQFWKEINVRGASCSIIDREEVYPDYVEIGYMLNTHKGMDLYRDGDTIRGLPIRINRSSPYSVALVAENVEFGYWLDDSDCDDDEELEERSCMRYEKEDIRVVSRW